jgi:hypothetical protein
VSLVTAALALTSILAVQAREHPDRPTRVVVPLAAGRAPDNTVRQLAEEFRKGTGQPIIVAFAKTLGSRAIIDKSRAVDFGPQGQRTRD